MALSSPAYDCPVVEQNGILSGPLRAPVQMLHVQNYDGHSSIHDDAMARKLGFTSGPIEGPTHFSQFAPLAFRVWGEAFFNNGAISVHYRSPVFEGDRVRALMRVPSEADAITEIWMEREDGAEILRGTLSISNAGTPTALETRLGGLRPLEDAVILSDVAVGECTPRIPVRMDADQHMGELYPFSLNEKLAVITERSSWYDSSDNPWGRPVLPLEMVSVLMQYRFPPGGDFPMRMPSVSLFADQEIRILDGPVFAGHNYEVVREAVFLSGSRRTESLWTHTRLYEPGTNREMAWMLLNQATLKESYAAYEADRALLYPDAV